MTIIGIDPGISGGICFLNVDNHTIKCYPMPTLEEVFTKNGKKQTRLIVDEDRITELLHEHADRESIAVVEKVSAGAFSGNGQVRIQGATSSFRFGKAFGVVLGVLAGCGIPRANRHLVAPQVWKKEYGLGSCKEDSIALACELFTCNSVDFTVNPVTGRKKAMDGIAEAALIAEYGYRRIG